MILSNAQIDKQRWDQKVLAVQPEGFFFMLSWYLDVVARTAEKRPRPSHRCGTV